MTTEFLFWVYFFGLLIALFQDLARREVDDWLNLLIFFSGFSYISFLSVFENDSSIFFNGVFMILVLFVVSQAFYFLRVFAGGDAKLLFAMCFLFVEINFVGSLINLLVFVFFMMASGSVYGVFYIGFLYFRNFKKANSSVSGRAWRALLLALFFSFALIFAGILDSLFFIFGSLMLVLAVMFFLSVVIEKSVMVREVSGKDLREGDWLAEPVRVGRKVIKPSWEGLLKEDIKRIGKRKVKIREGVPFVPAFVAGFFLYVFLKDWLLEFFRGFLV